MSNERVSLRDPYLNSLLPSYSITRDWELDWEPGRDTEQMFGVNKDSEEIPRNYWENSITVSQYLEHLYKLGILNKSLRQEVAFQKLLVKLHQQQSLGLLRNKAYEGQSEGQENLSSDWQKQFRSPHKLIIGLTFPDTAEDLKFLCSSFDESTWKDPQRHFKVPGQTIKKIDGRYFYFRFGFYAPPSVLASDNFKKTMAQNSLLELVNFNEPEITIFNERDSIHVLMVDYELFRHQTRLGSQSEQSGECMAVLYPAAKYIPAYLNAMRKDLIKVFEPNDKETGLKSLARAYQAGIRSQAFETVWNSEMMGIVNFCLVNLFQLKPIPHGQLDYKAFLLSPSAFADHFVMTVNFFQPK